MTYLFNDPATFMEEMRRGFLDAYADRIVGVDGGVVRSTVPDQPKAAVVVGGGSGHYPAFCGMVGPGFADGAVIGNIFTSPSVQDVYNVVRAADNGRGTLLTAGNYAGDKINFELAAERLRADGVDTRVVLITDDIASAPATESHKRRGIAGDFVVFKMASAAAEEGADLNTVEGIAHWANERTRTLGVAFDGCTMPGSMQPLFQVPVGQMSIGLGIHGEPGVGDVPLPAADDLAALLVSRLEEERPVGSGPRIAVVLNGLGTVKYEELFVLWGSVSGRLRDLGYEVVEPEIGELVTSLDMAGCSLTISWLDDDLERYWRAPAATPAYTKGVAPVTGGRRTVEVLTADRVATQASDYSRSMATVVCSTLEAALAAVQTHEGKLAAVDAVAGDGDHGRGMVRGLTAATAAAAAAAQRNSGAGQTLADAGTAWGDKAGGTSGVLWGAALNAAAAVLGGGDEPFGAHLVVAAAATAANRVAELGKAGPGDKTMLDAMLPYVQSLRESALAGTPFGAALKVAAAVADEAAQATADLVPQVGRARPLAARSIGTPDAGALSFALIVQAIADLART